jgi:tetratricopeptide (TPR) repeat protein
MPSLIPGYEYDIFISYRQKDNKGDRWVSEFVDALKTELESTFKEEISVYFDINPHDGLLETHDVDATLKEKLKCLVFIPIISRTYCDPKSFAWEHEFKAFVEQASKDQFGLKVKLHNGNVANRVIPVRIHDLDVSDIREYESVLKGVLRGVEFIYKESGIDKPLAPEDDEKKNLNNTKYRIQIIKLAHALKEIILGMKAEPVNVLKEKNQTKESFKKVREDEKSIDLKKPIMLGKLKLLTTFAVFVVFIITGLLVYTNIFKRDRFKNLKDSEGIISIAVMPFRNMTNDTIWNVWQEGIQENLITYLSNFPNEIKVGQTESVNTIIQSKGLTNYASITPSVAKAISQILDANVFIYGNIQQSGTKIRLNAKLIDTKTEEVLKSFEIDGLYKEEIIFNITDSLRKKVTDFLIISKLKKGEYPDFESFVSTNSAEAYKYFIYGKKAFFKIDFPTARNMLLQAISIDSNLTFAAFLLSYSYFNQGMYEEAKKWCLKLYEKRDKMSILQKTDVDRLYASNFGTTYDVIKYLKQLLEFDDQNPRIYYNLGKAYNDIYQYDNAFQAFEKALEIYIKWDSRPLWVNNYTHLGLAYHETGQYKKEKKLYIKAEHDFPNNGLIAMRQAILSFTEEDTLAAEKYIEKYISILRDNSSSEAIIKNNIAVIYTEAGILDRAEEYYRQALSIEPENPLRINNLAYFLVNKDRNIEEGLELADRVMGLNPDDFNSLHTKGWGLFKQGKNKEALDILQKSWDLRREKAIYNHEAFLHLEVAKKAVAGQKN